MFIFLIFIFFIQLSNNHINGFNPYIPRLAIDYGPRLIGIARSNVLGVIEPYATITNTGDSISLSHEIITLANSWKVKEILIGVPLDSDGIIKHTVRNINGRICINFAKVLSCLVDHEYCISNEMNILLYDERYTTKEAKIKIKQQHQQSKVTLDAMSAACLLERYIEDMGFGGLKVESCSYPPPKDLAQFDYNIIRQHVKQQFQMKLKHNDRSKSHINNKKFGIRRRYEQPPSDTSSSDASSSDASSSNASSSNASSSDDTEDEVLNNTSSNNDERQMMKQPQNTIRKRSSIIASDGLIDPVSDEELESDIIMQEYMRIKAQRRKKGTLKKKRD